MEYRFSVLRVSKDGRSKTLAGGYLERVSAFEYRLPENYFDRIPSVDLMEPDVRVRVWDMDERLYEVSCTISTQGYLHLVPEKKKKKGGRL